MDEKELEEHLEKIEKLVHSADRFNEMSFRMVLEGMIAKGGEEAEYLIVRFIHDNALDLFTRLNIIRAAGYIQSVHFLVPLKKIIEKEESVQLKKEAVISVAKYNNRQALNILNRALNSISNPVLLEVINNEIGKIKKNNPLFALLPRFQEGEKDPKNFQVTVDILKRILAPADAAMFTGYLDCGRPMIEEGAFEILCFTGGAGVGEAIFRFFRERCTRVPCLDQPECRELYDLVRKIKHYFFRHPRFIHLQLDNLGSQFFQIKDPRVREVLISVICRSEQPSALLLVNKVYDSDPGLRAVIVREYSGNDAAVDLLFEKYRNKTADEDVKRGLIRSLLKSRKGIDYFYSRFSSLEPGEKEMIVDQLPLGGETGHDLSHFIRMIFQTGQLNLKVALMKRAKEYYEFSLEEILFAPGREDEFSLVEEEYLDTITRLFPVTSAKKLMERIAYGDLSMPGVKRYLEQVLQSVSAGLVFCFEDTRFISRLINKIIFFNNPDLNVLFLGILRHIKTFDLKTVKNMEEAISFFINTRGAKISVKEGDEIRKIRVAVKDLLYEIKTVEDGCKSLEGMFAGPAPDADQLANLLSRYSLCISLFTGQVNRSIEKNLARAGIKALNQWLEFFRRFPMLGMQVKDAIAQKTREQKGDLHLQMNRLLQSLPKEPFKIVIRLNDRRIIALFRDQCREIIPGIPLSTEADAWQEGDMLICDAENLKDFILKDSLPAKKLFLILEKTSDFSSFQEYNPRTLVKPFSAYRIMKEILRELYI
jgi:hypothetical protein